MQYNNINNAISTANSETSGRLKKDISSKKRNMIKSRIRDGMGACGTKDGKGGCGTKDGKGSIIEDLKNLATNTSDAFKKGLKNTRDILGYYVSRPFEELKYRDALREGAIRRKEKKDSQWLRDQINEGKRLKEKKEKGE